LECVGIVKIIGIHHVQLTVPESAFADSRRFYSAVLGFDEITRPASQRPGGVWYRTGSAELHVSIEETENVRSRRHVCYVVENLDAARARCESAGVAILPDERPVPDVRRFFVRDPGGNRIEIGQASNSLQAV